MSRTETPAKVTASDAGRLMSLDWSTGVAISETMSPTARPTVGCQHVRAHASARAPCQ